MQPDNYTSATWWGIGATTAAITAAGRGYRAIAPPNQQQPDIEDAVGDDNGNGQEVTPGALEEGERLAGRD